MALIGLLALGIGGSSAVAQASGESVSDSPLRLSESGRAMLAPGPPSADEAGGERAPHSRPDTEQKACSIIPLSCNSTQGNDRLRHFVESRITLGLSARKARVVGVARSTTSLISSTLGRQFTLVGAKPSGTS